MAGNRGGSTSVHPCACVIGSRVVKWIFAVLVLTSMSIRAAAAPDWQLDPPPGWSRNETLERQFKAIRAAIPNIQLELRIWESPDRSAMLMAEWYLADLKHRTDHEVIEVLDTAPFEGSQVTMRVNKRERIVGSQVIRDSTGVEMGRRVRRLRRYQRTADGLHALILMCATPGETPCDGAIERAQLLASAPAPTDGAAHEQDVAPEPAPAPWTHRLGLVLGIAGGLALVIALGFRRRDLQRRKRRGR